MSPINVKFLQHSDFEKGTGQTDRQTDRVQNFIETIQVYFGG